MNVFPELLKASGWLIGLSFLTFLTGAILVPVIVLRLPSDFFIREEEHPHWHFPHTLPGWVFWIARNLLGMLLLVAGVAMLVLPGQGVLTIIAGIMAMTLPGKQQLVLRLVRLGKIQASLNWIRQKGGKPPLVFAARIKRPFRKQSRQKSRD